MKNEKILKLLWMVLGMWGIHCCTPATKNKVYAVDVIEKRLEREYMYEKAKETITRDRKTES